MNKHLKGIFYCVKCDSPIGLNFYGLIKYPDMKLKVSIDHNLCLECQNNKGGKK
jgi:hypothetical protein